MPQMRVVSWNSTGESVAKGAQLQAVQAWLAGTYAGNHPQVDVFVIQEAQNGPGGAIYNMMNTHPATLATQVSLGPNINRPPNHCTEQPMGGGAGYLFCSHTNVNVVAPLTLWNYTTDGVFNNWLGLLNMAQRLAFIAASNLRRPAYTTLTIGGSNVFFITWHTPLGPSAIGGATMPGGGLLDSFVALEQSGLLPHAQAYVGGGGVIIIAGDLNTTALGLANNNYWGIGYHPLANFVGVGNNVDHILAWRPGGGGGATVTQGHNTPSLSVHNIVSGRVNW